MDPISQAAGADARQDEAVLAAARDEGAKAEHLRAKTIRTMVAPFKFEEQFVSGLIDEGLSVETARERAMAKLAAQFTDYPTDPTNTGVTMGADANDKRREAMGAVLLHRLNPREVQGRHGQRIPGSCGFRDGEGMPESCRNQDARDVPAVGAHVARHRRRSSVRCPWKRWAR